MSGDEGLDRDGLATDGKDRFDALMQLANFRRERQANRRQHEWKVTVGLWALLAAGIHSPPDINALLLAVGLLFLVWAHAVLWVHWHWIHSKRDGDLAFFFAEHAEKLFDLPDSPPPKKRPSPELDYHFDWKDPLRPVCWKQFLGQGGSLFQVLSTAVLAFVVLISRCHG